MNASRLTFADMFNRANSGSATMEELAEFKVEAWFRSTTTPDASAELLHAIDVAIAAKAASVAQ